jgi:anti-sigma factor RsiW
MEVQGDQERLLSYVSGALGPAETALLEGHIDVCPACREFTRWQSAVWEALDAFDPAPLSPDFDRRLYQRIGAPVPWWERLATALRPLPARHALPIAAMAVVVVGGIIWESPTTEIPKPRNAFTAQVQTLQPDQVQNALEDIELLRDLNHLVRSDSAESKM